jgi:hypothetical protein
VRVWDPVDEAVPEELRSAIHLLQRVSGAVLEGESPCPTRSPRRRRTQVYAVFGGKLLGS